MLVFSRRINQKFYIGENIEVTVLSINSSRIRIGIEAPKDIPVHREEIYEQIKAEKEQ